LKIQVADNRSDSGAAAALAIASALRIRLAANGSATVVFAAAPSQNETLSALISEPGIAWDRVTTWHLDEYAGATRDSSYSFRRYLHEHVFRFVTPAAFHEIHGEADDLEAECARYTGLLPQSGFDVALLGIGENGHLAFNDPPCDFSDPLAVRVVELAEACRVQQVHDGAFASLAEVPRQAFTLTIPTLVAAHEIFVTVPGPAKANAVAATIDGPISNECPASILQTHPRVTLFLDCDSATRLTKAI
jgi:glucosamine-6-phosphate deaminase